MLTDCANAYMFRLTVLAQNTIGSVGPTERSSGKDKRAAKFNAEEVSGIRSPS